LVVIGAGPIGLEAAAAALAAGFRVTLIESGEVGQHLLAWGHVELFTPFFMNAGPAGLEILRKDAGSLPADGAYLTGRELRTAYLLPLAKRLETRCDLRIGTRAVCVSRTSLLKGEAIGAAERARDPFRLLLESGAGEIELQAGAVFDCTGVFGTPAPIGPGGGLALGERLLAVELERSLPDLAGRDREIYAGRRTLLIGSGLSAATTVVGLVELCAEFPDTRFVWATREQSALPLALIADDPLPSRARLVEAANSVALAPPTGSEWRSGTQIVALRRRPAGGFEVTLRSTSAEVVDVFDRVVALVGFEPNDSLYRQLQIHECYASRGPMKLAARLLADAADGPADCLALGDYGPDVLVNPEPNYFILGAKSYGKNSAFLLRTGYEQVADALSLLPSPLGSSPAESAAAAHMRL